MCAQSCNVKKSMGNGGGAGWCKAREKGAEKVVERTTTNDDGKVQKGEADGCEGGWGEIKGG